MVLWPLAEAGPILDFLDGLPDKHTFAVLGAEDNDPTLIRNRFTGRLLYLRKLLQDHHLLDADYKKHNDDTGYVQTLYSPNIIEALDAVAPGKYLYLKPKNIHYTTANDDESSIWSNPSIWNRNCLSFDGLTDNALVYAATDAYVTALIARAPCVLAIHPGRGLP